MKSVLLYEKVGRRYKPVSRGFEYEHLSIPVGTFVLIHAYREGGKQFIYDVTPDTAAFKAAANIAKKAMVDAMEKASPAKPQIGVFKPYTQKQLALIEKFRMDMAEAGGLVPDFWQFQRLEDIAQAGIDAVNENVSGLSDGPPCYILEST